MLLGDAATMRFQKGNNGGRRLAYPKDDRQDACPTKTGTTCMTAHYCESAPDGASLVESSYGEVWRGDESPFQVMARRGALTACLRGEATECLQKPRSLMPRCA